jgi:hypothetical protein
MKRFFQAYFRNRIVHINVNAVISGLLSLVISVYFVELTRHVTNDPFSIIVFSYAIDGTIDFLIFAILHVMIYKHLIVNRKLATVLARDIALLQTHRLAFTIVTFVVGGGIQLLLILAGFHRTSSFVIGYLFGIAANRTVHTLYGLKKGIFKPLRRR